MINNEINREINRYIGANNRKKYNLCVPYRKGFDFDELDAYRDKYEFVVASMVNGTIINEEDYAKKGYSICTYDEFPELRNKFQKLLTAPESAKKTESIIKNNNEVLLKIPKQNVDIFNQALSERLQKNSDKFEERRVEI